jgi:hypothetical protein
MAYVLRTFLVNGITVLTEEEYSDIEWLKETIEKAVEIRIKTKSLDK